MDTAMMHFWEERNIHLINVLHMNDGATKCLVFSAAPNPESQSAPVDKRKVGSVVFVTGNNISMAFTTGSPLFEDNFDHDHGHYQPIPAENCIFGALKLMIEIRSIEEGVDDNGFNVRHAGMLADNFLNVDNAIRDGVEKGKYPLSDPLVQFVIQRRPRMEMILRQRDHNDFQWFKEMFLRTRRELLPFIATTLPKVAKLAIGRSVIYGEFVEHYFEHEDYSTWAVYLLRLQVLKRNMTFSRGVYPLLWHMLHFFGNQQEWSKTDDVWAYKNDQVPEPVEDHGPLCYFKQEYDEDPNASLIRAKILKDTVFDNASHSGPKLGRANKLATQRFAHLSGLSLDTVQLNHLFFEKEHGVLDVLTHKIPWLPWLQSYFPLHESDSSEEKLKSQICNATPAHTIALLNEIENYAHDAHHLTTSFSQLSVAPSELYSS